MQCPKHAGAWVEECPNCNPSRRIAPVTGSQLLEQAGVKIGDKVIWQPAPTVIGKAAEMHCTVKGIHLGKHDGNKGIPAIEVVDSHGNGYRAYPGELRPVNNKTERQSPLP